MHLKVSGTASREKTNPLSFRASFCASRQRQTNAASELQSCGSVLSGSGSVNGMAELDLELKCETRLDPRTGRWDVVRCESNGAEFVLGSYSLHHDAICEVLRLSRAVSMVSN